MSSLYTPELLSYSSAIPTHYNACLASGEATNMAFSMIPNRTRAGSGTAPLAKAAQEMIQAQKKAVQTLKDKALELKQPDARKAEIRKSGDALFKELDAASHNGIMKVKNKFDEMVESDKFDGSALDDLLIAAKFIATTAAKAWAKLRRMLMEAWDALIKFLDDVWERVKDAWESIEKAFEKAQDWLDEAWEKIEKFFA